MRIVVFGASGYVGGRLIPVLLERGHEVWAVTRSPASLLGYPWAADVDVVAADLFDPESLAPVLADTETAVDSA